MRRTKAQGRTCRRYLALSHGYIVVIMTDTPEGQEVARQPSSTLTNADWAELQSSKDLDTAKADFKPGKS